MQSDAQFRVQSFPSFRTRLGDALFPGHDHRSQELKGLFSEMLVDHAGAGGAFNTVAIGNSLADFVPARMRWLSEPWCTREVYRWNHDLKPALFQAMEEFLLNGGFQARLEVQRTFLTGLVAAGVRVEGTDRVVEELSFAGDWHHHFFQLLNTGRAIGIRFLATNELDVSLLVEAAHCAGFEEAQILQIQAGIGAQSSSPY